MRCVFQWESFRRYANLRRTNSEISYREMPEIDLKFVPFSFFYLDREFQFLSEASLEKFNEITSSNVRYVEMSPVNLGVTLPMRRFAEHYLATNVTLRRYAEWPALAPLRAATVADLHPLTLCLAVHVFNRIMPSGCLAVVSVVVSIYPPAASISYSVVHVYRCKAALVQIKR